MVATPILSLVCANRDGVAAGRNIYRHCKPITIIVAIDGLAQLLPARSCTIDSIDLRSTTTYFIDTSIWCSDHNDCAIRRQGHRPSEHITSRIAIDVIADLFPIRPIVIELVYPDMARNFPVHPIIGRGANRYCFAIVRYGHGISKPIAIRFAGDVFANLHPSVG